MKRFALFRSSFIGKATAIALFILFHVSLFAQTPSGTKITNKTSLQSSYLSGRQIQTASDSVSIIVQESGALVLQKSATPFNPLPNDTVYYSIVAKNTHNATLRGIHIVDSLPTSVLYLSSSGGSTSNSVLYWNIDSMLQGTSDTIHVLVRVLPNIPVGTNVMNIVHGTDTTGISTSSSAQIIIGALPQMTTLKSVSKDSVVVGDSLRYILHVNNVGNSPLTNVTMKDTLPVQLVNVSVSPNATLSNGIISYVKDTL